MKNTEFNAACRKWNVLYRDIFGDIPCITDYSCTREEYLAAMEKAVESGEPLKHLLIGKGSPMNPNALI